MCHSFLDSSANTATELLPKRLGAPANTHGRHERVRCEERGTTRSRATPRSRYAPQINLGRCSHTLRWRGRARQRLQPQELAWIAIPSRCRHQPGGGKGRRGCQAQHTHTPDGTFSASCPQNMFKSAWSPGKEGGMDGAICYLPITGRDQPAVVAPTQSSLIHVVICWANQNQRNWLPDRHTAVPLPPPRHAHSHTTHGHLRRSRRGACRVAQAVASSTREG